MYGIIKLFNNALHWHLTVLLTRSSPKRQFLISVLLSQFSLFCLHFWKIEETQKRTSTLLPPVKTRKLIPMAHNIYLSTVPCSSHYQFSQANWFFSYEKKKISIFDENEEDVNQIKINVSIWINKTVCKYVFIFETYICNGDI